MWGHLSRPRRPGRGDTCPLGPSQVPPPPRAPHPVHAPDTRPLPPSPAQRGRRGQPPYPRGPRQAQVLHDLLESRRLLRLLLVVQSDLLAEFPRIVRSRHLLAASSSSSSSSSSTSSPPPTRRCHHASAGRTRGRRAVRRRAGCSESGTCAQEWRAARGRQRMRAPRRRAQRPEGEVGEGGWRFRRSRSEPPPGPLDSGRLAVRQGTGWGAGAPKRETPGRKPFQVTKMEPAPIPRTGSTRG